MASWHFQQLKFVFGVGGFMSFYGGLSLAIYFLGEYGGVKIQYRFALIALLLLTLPIALVVSLVSSRRKKKRDAAEADGEGEEGQNLEESSSGKTKEKTAKASGTSESLDAGADEVVKFLKSSNLGTSGDAVYSLPWYLVAGATKSGKSSLILASDLNFQNLPSQRQSEQMLIRPTRSVDWRVTSDAVFIDIPGRFQNANSEGNGWESLIETIKKHRSKRPLDGLILSVDTEKVLHSDEREIEELAKTIRTKLDEATGNLKSKFPVYLVFTHADAIEGFRDSFSVSKKEGENLVWGSTIPLDKSDNAQALFDSEYEILQDSVMKRRLIRLSAPFSPTRQLRIFNFPLHFGSARRKLGTFVTTLFRPNPFSESPFLRGFYFTAVPVSRKRRRRGKPTTAQTVGETFFTKRLFRDVFLRDKDLVKTFHAQKQTPPVGGWILTVLGTFFALVLLGFSGFSLVRNYQFLQDAKDKGKTVLAVVKKDANRNPLEKPPNEAQEEIDAIENLRKVLVTLDNYEREGAPFYMRFGMYSGNRIYRDSLLNIYYNAIERRFRGPTIKKLESELNTFAAKGDSANPTNLTADQEKVLGKHYNLLAAYLMLSEKHKDKAEPTILADTLRDFWVNEAKLPPGNKVAAEAQLNFYFKQIDRDKTDQDDRSGFPRFTPNVNTVQQTRDKLKAYPAYLRYLNRKITEISKEVDKVTTETLLDGRGQGVLVGNPKAEIPGAFTIEGYRRYMKDAIANANEELRKEDWVMGRTDEDVQAKEDEINNLKERYFNLYIDKWSTLLRETKVQDYKTLDDMKKALRAFSNAESPMKILLLEVARNTKFSSKPKEVGWTDFSWISDLWSGKKPSEAEETVNPVEREFDSLFKFVGLDPTEDEKEKPLIDAKYGKIIERLNQTFGKMQPSEKEKISIAIEKKDPESNYYNDLDNAENTIDGLVKGFNSKPEADIAALLKEPLAQIRGYFGVTAFKQLKDDWAQRILPKAKEIENGYPFTDNGEADLTKLSAFLNPVKGELSEFYKNRLKDYFTEVNGQLVVKESSKYKFTPEFVAYLNNAFKLRKVLYGEGSLNPSFKYEFRFQKVDDAIIEITLDGTKVTSEETGSKPVGFPAIQGASSGVLMRFSSTEESSSTSGNALPPTSSANNSNSNVNTASPSTSAPPSNFLQDSNEATKTFQGTWGLFKFVEAGTPKKEGQEYILIYKLGSKTVKATIKPLGGDLFDKSIFRNINAPSAILIEGSGN